MTTVQTATGGISIDDLGTTLTHEHLVVGWLGWQLDPASRSARADALRACVTVAKRLVAQGVSTIVDPCPGDLGRDVELAAEVSAQSGLQVVVATGLYTQAAGLPTYQRSMSVADLTAMFLHELIEGIGDTGIRAGVIKCAAGPLVDGRLAAAEERVLRAAARASAQTSTPIIAHNHDRSPAGREQVRIMNEEGADVRRLVVGHADAAGDLRYFLKVLDSGARLAFDRFGLDLGTSDLQRVAAVAGLIAAGHAGALLLSTDSAMAWLGFPGDSIAEALRRCPNWTATYILDGVVPALRAGGVPDQSIGQMLTTNAANLFAAQPLTS
jgi:phosphotriesterase-related protein